MPSPTRKFGDIGEGIACEYLEKKGFEIIERNYWQKWGEIDIVALQKGILHFVEVKTLSWNSERPIYEREEGIRPEDNVHPKKLERLYRTIETYLLDKQKGSKTQDWQIDVIAIKLDVEHKKAKVKLIDNIVM